MYLADHLASGDNLDILRFLPNNFSWKEFVVLYILTQVRSSIDKELRWAESTKEVFANLQRIFNARDEDIKSEGWNQNIRQK